MHDRGRPASHGGSVCLPAYAEVTLVRTERKLVVIVMYVCMKMMMMMIMMMMMMI